MFKHSDCEMYLPELQLSVDQRTLDKKCFTYMNFPALNFIKEKYQQGPKLSISSSQTISASHEANTYIHYMHKNQHRALQGTLLIQCNILISPPILLHIISIARAPKSGSHETTHRISRGRCKSQIFQHAQKASGSTRQYGNSSLLAPPQSSLLLVA